MNHSIKQHAVRRRGVTLLELMLALSITAMVGLGVASMLTMISSSTQQTRDARSLLLRAHAGQTRLRSYLDTSLSLLQHDASKGLAVWLLDQRTLEQVNLSEMRVLWFDDVNGTLSVEWVNFPESWTELQIQTFDTVVADGSDYFVEMEAQRAGGMTESLVLIEGLTWHDMKFDAKNVKDAKRVMAQLEFEVAEGDRRRTLSTFGLANHQSVGG
jgi:type II secretory pathway pseudopilin PulG